MHAAGARELPHGVQREGHPGLGVPSAATGRGTELNTGSTGGPPEDSRSSNTMSRSSCSIAGWAGAMTITPASGYSGPAASGFPGMVIAPCLPVARLR